MTSGPVLVAGASGQLAAAIRRAFADRDVRAFSRAALDLTDPVAVARTVDEVRPALIVNCAAYNDVDGAEGDPTSAFAVNAFAVRSLARAAEAAGAILVHYSTDFVFDGEAATPYTEESRPSPRSTYASSKLLGEWFALDAPRAYALRVESLFGSGRDWTGRRGSLDGIVAGLESGREVTVFSDRVVSPSYVVDIAAATRHLVDTGAASGLYHCVNDGHATWEAVALEAARQLGVEPKLRPLTLAAVSLKAARPRYCALSPDKLRRAGFPMPSWQDALARWFAARGRAGTVE